MWTKGYRVRNPSQDMRNGVWYVLDLMITSMGKRQEYKILRMVVSEIASASMGRESLNPVNMLE